MKVISFIEQPSVIIRILKHLDLWEDPRPPPEPLEMVCEPDVDYVPWQDIFRAEEVIDDLFLKASASALE